MAAQGYPKNGNWCGEFAAAVVKSTGGTPPKNAAIASNWRNWGSAVEGAPEPGDVAVRRGARTGSIGSHVTFVESYDPKTGVFKGFGGNQGKWSSEYSADRFDFRRGDRDAIDASLKRKSAENTSTGSVKAVIDFSNLPQGAKKSGDELGKFKLLKINAAPQGAKDLEGVMTPGDLAHTPYVP
jgi:uncharacterized protein (TIGR02594 family)